jgi:hypothetical protein
MKTNQLIGLIGGALLVIGTIIPYQGMSLIQMVSFISFDILIGLLPIVCLVTGAAGAFMSWKNNGKVSLILGAVALVYILVASRFEIQMIFKAIPFLLVFLGAVALTVGGVMGMKSAQ